MTFIKIILVPNVMYLGAVHRNILMKTMYLNGMNADLNDISIPWNENEIEFVISHYQIQKKMYKCMCIHSDFTFSNQKLSTFLLRKFRNNPKL